MEMSQPPPHHDRDIPLPELIILWIMGVSAMLALVRSLMWFCSICCCRRTQEDDLSQWPSRRYPPPLPQWPPSVAINIQQQPPSPTRPAPNIEINVMQPPGPPQAPPPAQAPPPPARRPAILDFMDSVSWAIGAIARDIFNDEVK